MTVVPRVSNIAVYATKYQVPTGRLICRGLVEFDRVVASKTNGDRLGQLAAFLRGGNEVSLQAVTIEKDTRATPAATPPSGGVERPPVKPAIAAVVVKVSPRTEMPAVEVSPPIDDQPVRVPVVRPTTPP